MDVDGKVKAHRPTRRSHEDINQNIAAFTSYRNPSATNTQLGQSLEKLSSGSRINRAADDTAQHAEITELIAEITAIGANTTLAGDTVFSATAKTFRIGSGASQSSASLSVRCRQPRWG